MADATVIVGKLDYKELENSIDKLVDMVATKTTTMAGKFETAIDKMKNAMKDFAITQKVSVDLMKDAWRDMSASFDAMVKAQSGGGSGGAKGGMRDPNTIGGLEDIINAETKRRKEMELGSAELKQQNELISQRKKQLKEETATEEELRKAEERRTSALERQQAKQLRAQQQSYRDNLKQTKNLSENDITQVTNKLREMNAIRERMRSSGLFKPHEIQSITKDIDRLQLKLEKLQSKQPMSLSNVLGMPEGTLNEISSKMRALQQIKGTLNINDTAGFKTINDTYARLQKQQDAVLSRNKEITNSNNALARSFGYIRNRIVYAFTIGAISNFIKQIYDVRGEYELLERSLGILTGKMEQGTKIFNELNEMAIKSPFTLIELGTAAKQLTAYNFAADEVVDTTRRLADISAALGVPMERLTYNLGQIKAQGVLNARDARDFANAGLAIVPMLAQMYTEQKKFGDEAVTTAKVYDMMSKKLVTYNDVLNVLYRITDEGGKFFNYQEKQADTLRVQLMNLTLAYNNMTNEIGNEYQSALSAPVRFLRLMLQNWREVYRAIMTVVVALGTYKTISFLALASDNIAKALYAYGSLAKAIKTASAEMAIFNAVSKLNPIGLTVGAIAAAAAYFGIFNSGVEEASQQVQMFGENASKTLNKVETLYKVLQGTDNTSKTYKQSMEELNEVLREYGVLTIKESDDIDEVNRKRSQAIELIKLESSERERANNIKKAQEEYDQKLDSLQKALYEKLKNAKTIQFSILGTEFVGEEEEIQKNAEAISDIVAQVVAANIDKIKNKTGEEYKKGLHEIFSLIQERMRAIGISEGVITKEWLEKSFAEDATNIIDNFINGVRLAKEEQDNYNEKIEKNYVAAKKATEATMSFTEKVDANARALRNNASDALTLYNRIKMLVDDYAKTHTIKFDLKLTAQQPPKWMFDKTLPELQQLAERFASVAQAGGAITGYNNESTYERALQYAAAARQMQEEEERKTRANEAKTRTKKSTSGGSKKDTLGEALQKEIQLITDIQKRYKEYQKMGVDTQTALTLATNEYNKSLEIQNKVLSKYNLRTMTTDELAKLPLQDVRDFYQEQLKVVNGLKTTKGVEALEKAIANINTEITKIDYKKITDGLNNELNKIKEEYEIGVELDANPELGDIFADMLGISSEELKNLPRDLDEAMKKIQPKIDELLSGKNISFNLADNLKKDVFDTWAESIGQGVDSELKEALNRIREYFNKQRLDETKKQIEEWDKLLEKYSEYEEKRKKIMEDAEQERIIARKKNAPQSIFDAIDIRERRQLADLDFTEFQKSPDWVLATGNLSNLSSKALGLLIQKLEEYKRSATNLDPKQIERINKTLRNLRKEMRKNNPFSAISDAIDEGMANAAVFDGRLELLDGQIENLLSNYNNLTKEQRDELKKLINEYNRLIELQEEASKPSTEKIIGIIGDWAGKIQSVANGIKSIGEAIGSEALTKTADALGDVAGNVQAAAEGYKTWGGWWGAVIGGVTDGLPKIIKWLSGDNGITEKVKDSELEVKKLENAYKSLEHTINNMYGEARYGAEQLAVANKKLQLAELERQLALEKSRKKKNQDESKILDLEGSIIDLKNEINDSINAIANDMLGISSVGDAAENLVSSMIEAFKNGEDWMKSYDETFESMIDNMIMKAIVGKVIGQRIQQIFDYVDSISSSEKQGVADQLAELTRQRERIQSAIATAESKLNSTTINSAERSMISKVLEQLRQQENNLNSQIALLTQQYNELGQITPENVDYLRELVSSERDATKRDFEFYADLFGLRFGQNKESANLSALQQGIQGITEDTAGALEAYMNSVSQQVYLHSDLLLQIRDAVVALNGDIQLATNAQMLLQLQQSYQVQMAIQTILVGWSNPSGSAVKVELLN